MAPKASRCEMLESFNPNRKGDIFEKIVMLTALLNGAEVYENVGCSGKTDVMLEYKGKSIGIDVKGALAIERPDRGTKTMRWPHNYSSVKKPIYAVCVWPTNDLWYVNWATKGQGSKKELDCPSGWENLFNTSLKWNINCSRSLFLG